MYKLNCDGNSVNIRLFEENEELWKQKIKEMSFFGIRKKDKEYDLKEFCSELKENRINYEILKEHFEKIEVIGIVLNSFSGVRNDELSSVCKEVIENINPFIVNVSLDSRSYNSDRICYMEGDIFLDIERSSLEIKEGEIMFSGYDGNLKNMTEYINEVEEFLLPENREALHQNQNIYQNIPLLKQKHAENRQESNQVLCLWRFHYICAGICT